MAEEFALYYPAVDLRSLGKLKTGLRISTVFRCYFCMTMKDNYLVDFYLGWSIEVAQVEGKFSSVCYSSGREKFINPNIYDSDVAAICAAKQMIDQYGACNVLTQLLRELYETHKLGFEDWRSLHQSLTHLTRTA